VFMRRAVGFIIASSAAPAEASRPPESVADLRRRTADVAETQEPERPPGHVIADGPPRRRCRHTYSSDNANESYFNAIGTSRSFEKVHLI
jgi:hypothetical protein